MAQCQRFLENNLFIANPTLRPALLNLREMCYGISGMTLCRIEKGKTSTLLGFLSSQMSQLSEVNLRLTEFHELIKEIIRSACRTALLEYGFMPDDYFQDEADLPGNLGRNALLTLSAKFALKAFCSCVCLPMHSLIHTSHRKRKEI